MTRKLEIHPAGLDGHLSIVEVVLPSRRKQYQVSIQGPNNSALCSFTEEHATDVYSLVDAAATALVNLQTFAYGYDSRPYLWSGSKWEEVDAWLIGLSTSMHRRIRSGQLLAKNSPSFYNTVRSIWRSSAREELTLQPFGKCRGVPLKDCVLELADDGVIGTSPHKPENQNLHCLPIEFDDVLEEYVESDNGYKPESMLSSFLMSSLGADQRVALQRWFGLHLAVHRIGNPEKLLYMVGSGGNGKGVVIKLLRALVTDASVASLRLRDLKISSNLELLAGKLAMVSGEASPDTDQELLKAIVSWEELNVNPKYRDPFGLTPRCLVTQASNHAPQFNDDSDAMARRAIVLTMENQPSKASKIAGLGELIREKEYAQLVAWSIYGAQEIIRTGTIEIPESVAAYSNAAVRPVRTVDRFMEVLEFGSFEIADDELYQAYCIHTKRQALSIQPKNEILKELESRLTRAGRVYVRRSKVTGYTPQKYLNEQAKEVVLVPALLSAKQVKLFFGFRISAGNFGPAIGQRIPEYRRELPSFDDLPVV